MRLHLARLTLAGRLLAIHKEAWIPVAVALIGYRATGPTWLALIPANLALWLAWDWHHKGAYRRNAEDTMLARFHYSWAIERLANPGDTPTLVAVTIERAPRRQARDIRKRQGRHALGARRMTITVRPHHDQVGKNWAETWTERTKVRFGFQTTTDPRASTQDTNATVIEFGQERMPDEVRAVVA